MIPLDVVTCGFYMVRMADVRAILSESPEIFRFPIMKPSFRFAYVKVTAVPATSFVNDLLKMYVAQHTKRQAIKMRKFNMFITAICVLFLVKLRWPKNKSLYDTFFFIFFRPRLNNLIFLPN